MELDVIDEERDSWAGRKCEGDVSLENRPGGGREQVEASRLGRQLQTVRLANEGRGAR